MGLRVIAIDSGDEKRKMCLEQLGAAEFVDFATSKDVVADVKQATEDGLGPHAVLLVAVQEKPFQQAAEVCLRHFSPAYVSSQTSSPSAAPLPSARKEKVTNPFLLHQYVRPRGTVVCIGLPANAYLRAPVFDSVIKMVNIKGSYVGNRKDTAEALDFYRRGMIKAPFKTVPLKELPKVYELMEKGQIAGRYVLDMSDA